MIYLISCKVKCPNGCLLREFIKIGKCPNRAGGLERRMHDLQTGNPWPLDLVAHSEWPDYAEQDCHEYLRRDRVRGEWFKRSTRVEEIITLMHKGMDGQKELLELLRADLFGSKS